MQPIHSFGACYEVFPAEAPHADLEASGLDGRSLPVRRLSGTQYRLESAGRSAGVVVVRARFGGMPASKLVPLP